MSAVSGTDLIDQIVGSTEGMRESIERLAKRKGPTVFTLKTPALKQGRTNMPLAATQHLWIQLKCYASGGENSLHAHPHEDHLFVILQGEAVFYGKEGETARLRRNQGIMMPSGVMYRFHAASDENLILLRIGAPSRESVDILARIDEHGRDIDAFSARNVAAGKKREPTMIDAGHWFE